MIKELIRKHEERLRQIKEMEEKENESFIESIKQLASTNGDDKDFILTCYWETDINANFLYELFGYKNLKSLQDDVAGNYGIKLPCYVCGADVLVYPQSRSRLANLRSKSGRKEVECPDCIRNRELRHKKAQKNKKQKERLKLQELKTMPYSEYLETEHWNKVRKEALREAGYKCEICGVSGIKLSVHHKTYERRGCERLEDLSVLCEVCHAEVHNRMVTKEMRDKRDNHLIPLKDRVLKVLCKA